MVRKGFFCGILVVVLCAGCGHDGIIEGSLPGQQPADPPAVSGGVLAPNSTFAQATLWNEFASLIVSPVFALSDNVQPIGADEVVTLARVTAADAADGSIDSAVAVSTARTNEGGRFATPLIGGAHLGDCGLMLEVGRGSDGTLTRALVYAQEGQDLTAVSEAVVRRILAYLSATPGRSLCSFDPDEIANLTFMVQDASADTGGASVSEINARVESLAATNLAITRAIQVAGSS